MRERIRLALISGAGAGCGLLLMEWIISTNPTALFIGAVFGAVIFTFIGGGE